MEPSEGNALVRVATTAEFEGHTVVIVEIDQRRWMSARQIAEAFEYTRPDQLVTNITSDWSEELEEGTDYRVVRGAELALAKEAGLADSRAPSLLMLSESGVHLVSLLSRQPKAKLLRRWLAEEIMPQLVRTGAYSPDHQVEGGRVVERTKRRGPRGRLYLPENPQNLVDWVARPLWQEGLVDDLAAGRDPRRPVKLRDVLMGEVLVLMRSIRVVELRERAVRAVADIAGRPPQELVGDPFRVGLAQVYHLAAAMTDEQLVLAAAELGGLQALNREGLAQAELLRQHVRDEVRMMARVVGLVLLDPVSGAMTPEPTAEELEVQVAGMRELRSIADELRRTGAIDEAEHAGYLRRAAALVRR